MAAVAFTIAVGAVGLIAKAFSDHQEQNARFARNRRIREYQHDLNIAKIRREERREMVEAGMNIIEGLGVLLENFYRHRARMQLMQMQHFNQLCLYCMIFIALIALLLFF